MRRPRQRNKLLKQPLGRAGEQVEKAPLTRLRRPRQRNKLLKQPLGRAGEWEGKAPPTRLRRLRKGNELLTRGRVGGKTASCSIEEKMMRSNARDTRKIAATTRIKSALLWILEIIVVMALGVLLALGLGKATVMQEGSMDPTLAAGDMLLINRAAYKVGAPKRGDIIAFKLSDDKKASLHIKRVIGLPGETIQIRDGQILIDGETYQEQKNFPSIQNPGIAENPVTLGSGEYFVLGDNRNNSEDSRFADIGNVEKKYIVGKLWFVVSPLEKFGLLEG